MMMLVDKRILTGGTKGKISGKEMGSSLLLTLDRNE